ncbi:MAG: lysophospholipase [Deltaproteobacteria bacterium]|nr:lysophospholipase [Deltaproteobacteria bacterium]
MSIKYSDFKVLAADGVDLQCVLWQGTGDARGVICLIHGIGEHSGRYDHFARKFAEIGYPVLSFDLRGHGRSGGKRGHSPSGECIMRDLEKLLAEARSAFRNLPIFLYGHSLGGLLVINLLLGQETGVAAAIVSGPALRPIFPIPQWKLSVSRILRRIIPTLSIPTGLNAEDISRDPLVVARYKADKFVHSQVSVAMAMDVLAMGDWALANAQKLKTPMLVMHGLQDRLTSAVASKEFSLSAGALCEFKGWDDLWHELHNEPEWEVVFLFVSSWMEKAQNP